MTFEDIEKAAQNVQTLSDLFQLWQKAHEFDPNWEATFPKGKESGVVEAFKTSFCVDGVSSLDGKYSGGDKADVLFLLKESNIGQDELRKAGITHPFWFNEEPSHSTREKYAKRFKAALERYQPHWDDKAPIGYMNLNKRGGAGYTESKRLKEYICQYHKFILKEIEIIAPKMIFLCGCKDGFLSGIMEAIDEPKSTVIQTAGDTTMLVLSDGIKPIITPIYHPSYPRFSDCLN
ncbi:MAG: hypothetical protein J6M64_04850 [Oscillospiraceae bacterium]|nr:hypothetical protein [Oscillospiraceae bacterium]